MAERAGGHCADLESLTFADNSFDLCLSVGLLDTANDLAMAVTAVRGILRNGGLFIGAIGGGQSLPRLRGAMLAADRRMGRISPHVHPRIEPANLAQLLTSAGFGMPVIDVDRIELIYASLDRLVADLRAMGATNILSERSRTPLLRTALEDARQGFLGGRRRAAEQIEIIHFAAWKDR